MVYTWGVGFGKRRMHQNEGVFVKFIKDCLVPSLLLVLIIHLSLSN
jgi:hypothetical protein